MSTANIPLGSIVTVLTSVCGVPSRIVRLKNASGKTTTSYWQLRIGSYYWPRGELSKRIYRLLRRFGFIWDDEL